MGVDVGGTRLRVVAQDVHTGLRLPAQEVQVPGTTAGIVDAIERLSRQATRGGNVGSIAVGLPGQVLDSRCIWVPNLRFLDGVDLAALVSERLGAPCHLINDAQATLLAEVREGAARGCRDAVLVAVGTGIGGAYLTGGELVRGAHGCAGAFGWLPMTGSHRDEDHGQWERVGSGRALDQLAGDWGSTRALLDAARQGQPDARGVVLDYAAVLGQGIAALASVFDPDVVVFGGGLVSAFDLLGEAIRSAVSQHGSPAGSRIAVIPAELGSAAGVIGAALWAAECRPGIPPQTSEGAR